LWLLKQQPRGRTPIVKLLREKVQEESSMATKKKAKKKKH